MTSVFERIYQHNEWNGIETRSGPGSGTIATTNVYPAVVALIAELGVRSVVDAACGEAWWQPEMPGYLGLDISAGAIEVARRNHPTWSFQQHDALQGLPKADLVLCRDVLQHLSLVDGVAFLGSVKDSGSTWLLASTYRGTENVDIATGETYGPNLVESPFEMGEPERVIFDGWSYHDPDLIRDGRKFLGLWRLTRG